MSRFANPEFLYALYLIPVFIGIYIFIYRNKIKALRKFAEREMWQVLFPGKSFFIEHIKFALLMGVFALIVLSAARLQVGSKLEEVKQTGIDVFIVLDVSNSMLAEDLKPNRLEKAKNEIALLLRKLQGDRMGMIIFAGEPFMQIPLTSDYSAANLFLNAVNTNSIPTQGTALASALNLAVKSFDKKSPTQKVIIAITDGEDHEGDIDGAVKEAVENGIKVYAIGMGSPAGAPIPVYDGNKNRVGFKQDADGNPVITKLDEITLEKIANDGDGKYFRAVSAQNELDLIYKDLSALEKAEFGSKRVTEYDDKYYYFLIPAILLLLVEVLLRDKKWKFVSRFLLNFNNK
ncbi:MAG: VWA domain-containing protein [Ignavibacteriaceae bacterium]|nr:VWA domain-containing protein [Ignavibacteriaceae bacterium]